MNMPIPAPDCAVVNNGALVASMLFVAILAFACGCAFYPVLRDFVLVDHKRTMESNAE